MPRGRGAVAEPSASDGSSFELISMASTFLLDEPVLGLT